MLENHIAIYLFILFVHAFEMVMLLGSCQSAGLLSSLKKGVLFFIICEALSKLFG